MTILEVMDIINYYIAPVVLTFGFVSLVFIIIREARAAHRRKKRDQREQQIH